MKVSWWDFYVVEKLADVRAHLMVLELDYFVVGLRVF